MKFEEGLNNEVKGLARMYIPVKPLMLVGH